MSLAYCPQELTAEQVQSLQGPVLLAFGTNWCSHCQAAAPEVDAALALYPQTKHLQIEDGKGRRLGRAFGVKLWPTLIFLRNGVELDRLVRPTASAAITDCLKKIQA